MIQKSAGKKPALLIPCGRRMPVSRVRLLFNRTISDIKSRWCGQKTTAAYIFLRQQGKLTALCANPHYLLSTIFEWFVNVHPDQYIFRVFRGYFSFYIVRED
jgi:hypothetical protein